MDYSSFFKDCNHRLALLGPELHITTPCEAKFKIEHEKTFCNLPQRGHGLDFPVTATACRR
jgi:hypothetical protein